MSDIEDLKALSDDNVSPPPDGAPEKHARLALNNISREIMGKIRRDWDGTATGGGPWRNPVKGFTVTFISTTQLRVAGVDATPFFPPNRKVKVVHSTSSDAYAFVASSTYSAPDTTIDLEDFDDANQIAADCNGILFSSLFGGTSGHEAGRAAYVDDVAPFVVPAALTAAALQTAIDRAATNGWTVHLETGTYVLEAQVTIPTGCRLLGRGPGRSILQVANGVDATAILVDDGADNVELASFELDGNAANQTAGGGIGFQNGHRRIGLRDLYVHDIFDAGIAFTGVATGHVHVSLDRLWIDTCGRQCIRIDDPDGSTEAVFISRVYARNPGTGGAAVVSSDAIVVQGKVQSSQIDVRMDVAAGNTGAAFRFDYLASGGFPLGGSSSTLSGFKISGTGPDATGVFVGGRQCRIYGGVVSMSGASAIPLRVDGRSSAANEVSRNIGVEDCIFDDGIRCIVDNDAEHVDLIGCRFRNQSAEGLRIDGDAVNVMSCSFADQPDGIVVRSQAENATISQCVFSGQADDGVVVEAGATGARIFGNLFRDIFDDAILVDAAAVDAKAFPNEFDSIGGDNLNEGGLGYDGMSSRSVYALAADQSSIGSETAINNLVGVQFPFPPNGNRRFKVRASITLDSGGSATATARLRMGTSGTIADALQHSIAGISITGPGGNLESNFHEYIVAPADQELLTLSIEDTGGSNDPDAVQDGTAVVGGSSLGRSSIELEYVDEG